ncbi:MAG TPA: substrate-binding domain-containing protein [Planctomycetota bacterium]
MRKVGLLIDTASSYGRGLLRGIARYARLRGPWTLGFDARDVDGVLALVRTPALARRALAAKIPYVDLDFTLPRLAPWPVRNDERAVAATAAAHLAERGFRSFAFCGWNDGSWWESERLDAFRKAVEGSVAVYGRGSLAAWLRSLPRPCGLFACNDLRGHQVLEAARTARVRIPEDVAVIGVDDDEVLCEMSVPPLSSVGLDTIRIGFEGAALLDRLMGGGRRPRKSILIPPRGAVTRQSSDILASADPAVVAAARFTRANVHRPLAVPDLARAAGVSRKTLETRFRAALGRTPRQEILRARLERVRDLLLRTDWPLKRVAAESGFTYPEHLHAVFRRHEGVTPAGYRRLRQKP